MGAGDSLRDGVGEGGGEGGLMFFGMHRILQMFVFVFVFV